MILQGTLTLFQPGEGGGWNPPPRGFSLAIALNVNWSTSHFLTFNIHYRDINWQKIKSIAGQGVTWSFFCRKHFASPHIFHCIYIEFSSSALSVFWHWYLVLSGVLGSKNILWVIFLSKRWHLTKLFADVSIFEMIQNFDYFSGFCSPEFDLFMNDLVHQLWWFWYSSPGNKEWHLQCYPGVDSNQKTYDGHPRIIAFLLFWRITWSTLFRRFWLLNCQ